MQGVHRLLEIHYNRVGELYVVKETDKCIQVCAETVEQTTDMPDKYQYSKETQSDSKGSEIESLNRFILQFIKDYLSFENEFKVQASRDKNRNSYTFYKETLDLLIHLVKVSMQSIQKNPAIIQIMMASQLKNMIQSADRMTSAASKLKKIQNNYNRRLSKRIPSPKKSGQKSPMRSPSESQKRTTVLSHRASPDKSPPALPSLPSDPYLVEEETVTLRNPIDSSHHPSLKEIDVKIRSSSISPMPYVH